MTLTEHEIDIRTGNIINKLQQGGRFSFHSCSMCGYKCCYFYTTRLIYDAGCDCTGYILAQEHKREDIKNLVKWNPETNWMEERYWI